MDEKKMTFEDVVKDMTSEQMQEHIREGKNVCKEFCGNCPSYAGTGETDFMFCSIGKSKHIKEEKGCICGGCPIQKKMSLRWNYYCTRGSGNEQAGIK